MFSTCGSEKSPIIEQELVAQIVESRWLSKNCLFAIFYLVVIFCSFYHQKDENSGGTKSDEGGKAWNIFAIKGRIQPERHPEGTITCEQAAIEYDKKDHTKDVWQWTPDQAQQTDWALQGYWYYVAFQMRENRKQKK